MSKIEDESYLKRSRSTWLAEKLDINFAKAHAIMHNISKATPNEAKKISKAIREDRRSSIYKKIHK